MRLLLPALTLLVVLAIPAAAQDMQPDTACTYETCALRAKGSLIVRGREQVVVSKQGLPIPELIDYDPGLTQLGASSPAAADYAVEYERLQTPTATSYYGGIALLAKRASPTRCTTASESDQRWEASYSSAEAFG